MNLKTFIDIYDLHDSGIKSIHYFPDQKKLVIDLIFCNWKQTFYKAEEPELVLGELIFTDVSHYRLQEIYKELGQSEILSVNILKGGTNLKNMIEIIISSIYLSNKERQVKLIEIEANDVVWQYVRAYE